MQHMGVASLACVSGCTCKPSRIDATTPHLLSLFMPFVFEVRSWHSSRKKCWGCTFARAAPHACTLSDRWVIRPPCCCHANPAYRSRSTSSAAFKSQSCQTRGRSRLASTRWDAAAGAWMGAQGRAWQQCLAERTKDQRGPGSQEADAPPTSACCCRTHCVAALLRVALPLLQFALNAVVVARKPA